MSSETFREYLQEGKKISEKDIVKMIKHSGDFGDLGDQVYVNKGNLVILDTYFYGGDNALKSLKNQWVDSKGSYYKYFNEEHGIEFELVDSFMKVHAQTAKEKRLTKDGIVGIILKIKG